MFDRNVGRRMNLTVRTLAPLRQGRVCVTTLYALSRPIVDEPVVRPARLARPRAEAKPSGAPPPDRSHVACGECGLGECAPVRAGSGLPPRIVPPITTGDSGESIRRRRRWHAVHWVGALRQQHEQRQPARSRPAADPRGRRRLGTAERRSPPRIPGAHADVEPDAVAARQAGGASGSVRGQHGKAGRFDGVTATGWRDSRAL